MSTNTTNTTNNDAYTQLIKQRKHKYNQTKKLITIHKTLNTYMDFICC